MKYITQIILLALVITSCSKKDHGGQLSVQLHSSPTTHESVIIDVQGVKIHFDKGSSEEVTDLTMNKGLYDLADMQYNNPAKLVNYSPVDNGKIKMITLVIGDNNQIRVNGTSHDLLTAGNTEEINILLPQQMKIRGVSNFLIELEIDSKKSVVHQGNDVYKLKPVIFMK